VQFCSGIGWISDSKTGATSSASEIDATIIVVVTGTSMTMMAEDRRQRFIGRHSAFHQPWNTIFMPPVREYQYNTNESTDRITLK